MTGSAASGAALSLRRNVPAKVTFPP